MKERITESQFYMWRALFAMAHADDVVTDEEIRYMAEVMEDVPFNEAQQKVLNDDIKNPKDIIQMFEGIKDARDQAKFFKFAQELVWVDGDYGKEEQAIMLKLIQSHVKTTNVDDLIGSVHLEFDDDGTALGDPASGNQRANQKKKLIFSFREQFFKNR
jgi:hypothetical protein